MLNNTPLKLQCFLYVVYDDDAELNGWLIPDPTTIASPDGTAFKIGLYQAQAMNWWIAGRRYANREARQISMKDLRTGLYERDILGAWYSTDFNALSAIQYTVLPNGASAPASAVSGQRLLTTALATGRDGGISYLTLGLTDLTTVSFERTEAAMNLGDVIAYDRRGGGDAPSTGPGATWEEVYGADYPYNWVTGGRRTPRCSTTGCARALRRDSG